MKLPISRFVSSAAGLIIFLTVFLILRQMFVFQQIRDTLLLKNYSIYFIIVSYLLATLMIPVDCTGRTAGYRKVVYRTLLMGVLTMVIFAFHVFLLFDFFAGRFYMLDGFVSTSLLCIFNCTYRLISVSLQKNSIKVAIAGNGPNAIRLCNTLKGNSYKNIYYLKGFFCENASDVPAGQKFLGSYSAIEKYLVQEQIHDLYCCLSPSESPAMVNDMVHICENHFINFFYVPNLEGYLNRSMSTSEIGHVIVMNLRDEPLQNPLNAFLKRMCDIVLSFLFLCTLFPVFYLFAAIGIKFTSPGPVFFKQKRTGYKGKPFTMLKFRSMKVNEDSDRLFVTKDDPRKTKFGHFLRHTSIDELPQFINVLIGNMSIIGPRPHMIMETEQYSRLVDEFMVRHAIKPGLTGWAQVNGCRGEINEPREMEKRVENDIWYVEHWSFALDIKIFIMTIIQIISGDKQAY